MSLGDVPMEPFDFCVGECDSVDRFLAERIYEFNVQATSYSDGESFAAVRRDESEAIVAGVSGYTWGGCCYVSHLWVSETLLSLMPRFLRQQQLLMSGV